MSSLSDRLRVKLAGLVKDFTEQLPERMDKIIEAYESLKNNASDTDKFYLFKLGVHKLAGSGATFGFPELANRAQRIESYLRRLQEEGKGLNDKTWKYLDAEIEALSAEVDETIPEIGEEIESEKSVESPNGEEIGTRHVIFINDHKDQSSESLAEQLGFFGYQVSVRTKLLTENDVPNGDSSVCLIVQTEFIERDGVHATAFLSLREAYRDRMRILYVGEKSDFNTLLKTIRAGGDGFINMPIEVGKVIDKIESLFAHRENEPYHVLIVDDDPDQVSYYALLLQQAGMITSVASDPKTVMGILVDAKPELILMDMYMPECTGMELALIIRQNEAFVSTPIVYLSIEEDIDKQLDAIRIGGDGFISKSISPDYLLAFITNMLERNRSIRYFMERDSLTGLLNHTNLKGQLEREVIRAERSGYSVSFAMIDADNFKRVNDSYGHLTGDKVLRTLSRLLQDRLRRTDIIGRYGGEEFGVILLNTGAEDAAHIMDELRESFAHVKHQAEHEEFYVTFSCGVASYPASSDSSELTNAADKALYEAKETGRNKVVIADK